MREDANEPVRVTIYGDFDCPFSALASARAAYPEARSLARIEWRLRVPQRRANTHLATSAHPIVPTMVLADGYVSRGLGALSRLQLSTHESHASP